MFDFESQKKRTLDFDIENRPLAYLGSDFTTAEVTAIAWAWVDKPKTVHFALLGIDDPEIMLEAFRSDYDKADIVTGHYIREHDLPIINGALLEYQHDPLSEKETLDTKLDLKTLKGISKSQENLCAALGIEAPKIHMNNAMWRASNRLTKQGIEWTRQRVVGDVIQHMQLRKKLIELDYLSSTKIWTP